MQLPRQLKDLLMLMPSSKPWPVVCAVSVFSEPARSTKVILEVDFLSAWLSSSVKTAVAVAVAAAAVGGMRCESKEVNKTSGKVTRSHERNC